MLMYRTTVTSRVLRHRLVTIVISRISAVKSRITSLIAHQVEYRSSIACPASSESATFMTLMSEITFTDQAIPCVLLWPSRAFPVPFSQTLHGAGSRIVFA